MVFSPDGTVFVTSSVRPLEPQTNSGFSVWDSETGNKLAGPPGMTDATVALGFSADGRTLTNIGTTTWWAWMAN